MNLGHGCTFEYIETTNGVVRYRLMLTRRVTGLPARVMLDALVNEATQDPTIVVVREGQASDGIVTRGRAKFDMRAIFNDDATPVEDLNIVLPDGFTMRANIQSVAEYVVPRAKRFLDQLEVCK